MASLRSHPFASALPGAAAKIESDLKTMELNPGAKLGPYEVVAMLGKGGMGEVWRARDTRLDRTVALKVSKSEFSARFEREARAIAALNHPHICQLYDVGPNYLVMEYIDGAELKGLMPVARAIELASQILDALDAAHRKGIVHRDLKPANILVTKSGVKVLDFGLAKMQAQAVAMGADAATAISVEGTIAGTLYYMAPEQLQGKEVDARADIFSFGCVLYEMLTGKRAFDGSNAASVIAAVMERPAPSISDVAPPALDRVLKRCLGKDPEQRWQTARDLKSALELAQYPAPLTAATSTTRSKLPWALVAVFAALAAGGGYFALREPPVPARPLIHFTTYTPEGIYNNPVAVSPDGSQIAFVAANRIYLRRIDDPSLKPVPGTENASFPSFSPDGQWLAFFAGTPLQLKKVPIAGGAALPLANVPNHNAPMSWGDDGNILLGGTEIVRVPEAGGQPVVIAKLDSSKGETVFLSPELLPDGKHILVTLVDARGPDAPEIASVDLRTGEKRILLEAAGECLFARTGAKPDVGHLVYARNGSMFAAKFNAATLQLGPARPVLEGMRNLAGLNSAGLSRSGTLAYSSGVNGTALAIESTLIWVDRQGNEQPLTAPQRRYGGPRLSPDGGRIAFSVGDSTQTLDYQIWVFDLTRGTTTRLTYGGTNAKPVWTPDGRRLIFSHVTGVESGTLAEVAADGSREPVTLTEGVNSTPMSVSPDGKGLIGLRSSNSLITHGNSLWVLPLDGSSAAERKPEPFLDTRFTRGDLQFSPDGKWVAYESNETGRDEIYVVPYPGPGGKSQVSTDGGAQPHWNRNGRELFFRNGAKSIAVDVETGAAFRAGAPRTLFEKVSSDYDVAPDGHRFLMLKPAAAETSELHVIVNWFDELRRRAPLEK
jgi:eukaryotic-like serine/threonine-protein kinase